MEGLIRGVAYLRNFAVTTLYMYCVLFTFSLPLLHDHDMKLPSFTFSGGCEYKPAFFFLFFFF